MGNAGSSNIIEVNNFIRGFLVSPGKHEITLAFKPMDIKYGTILTYLSFFLILTLIFSNRIRLFYERV